MKPTITAAEVLQELERAAALVADAGDAFTLRDLQEATGWGSIRTRNLLRQAKKAGRLEVVRVQRENLAGYLQATFAYRIVPAQKGKRKG